MEWSESMVELVFPNNQHVRIEFEENKRAKVHSYVKALQFNDGTWTDWMPTHGITTPLAMVPMPFLKAWASKLGVYAALEWAFDNPDMEKEVRELLTDVENKLDKTDGSKESRAAVYQFRKKYKWLIPLKTAYDETGGKEMGTWLHGAIENYYRSGRTELPILTPEFTPMWECFLSFDNEHKFEADKPDGTGNDGLEFFVYSLLHGYSGQGDCRGTMHGKRVIGDWKTTNRAEHNQFDGITIEYFYQVGGLAQAEFERTGEWVDDVFIANFSKEGVIVNGNLVAAEPVVIFASDFGMSVQDAAKCYVSMHSTFHMHQEWEYRFGKRNYR
jgi:hypothetical protein